MNWWNKVFSSSKPDQEMDYVQRSGRFAITILHHLNLKVQTEAGEKELPLKNISPSGLALSCPQAAEWFHVDKKVSAVLQFPRKSVAISLIPRHINGEVVGCQIDKGLKEYTESFQEYFIEESLASDMFQQEHPKGEHYQHYVTSNNRSSLTFEWKDGKLGALTLMILGNTMEMFPDGTCTFSFMVNSKQGSDKVVVKIHEFPDEVVVLALRFMQSVEVVPENIKLQICEQFKKHSGHKAA